MGCWPQTNNMGAQMDGTIIGIKGSMVQSNLYGHELSNATNMPNRPAGWDHFDMQKLLMHRYGVIKKQAILTGLRAETLNDAVVDHYKKNLTPPTKSNSCPQSAKRNGIDIARCETCSIPTTSTL